MGLLDDYENRRQDDKRNMENSARLAYSYYTANSTGVGSVQIEERVSFDLTFIEKPTVSYGSAMDIDDMANMLEDATQTDIDSDEVSLPICTGHVVAWDQDDRDFYTGAWVAVRVYFPSEDAIYQSLDDLEIEHHFSFAGIALKDIPPVS